MNVYRLLLCFLLFLPFRIFSQEIREDADITQIAKQQDKFFIAHVKISLNNVFLNNINYIETRISPFLKVSGFYLALDFPLKIGTDKGGILNAWTYLSPYNYFQFVDTIGYTTKSHIFDLKIGTISDLSLGEGLLLSHFRNDLFLPYFRQHGILLNFRWAPYIELDFFSADITNFGMGGTSLSISPLFFLPESNIFSKMQISGSFIYDVDTKHIIYKENDILNWKHNPKSSKRYAYAVTLGLPFWQNKRKDLTLGTTLEYAETLLPARYAAMGKFFLHYQGYKMNIGVAYLTRGFHMNYFSPLYLQPTIRDERGNSENRTNSIGYLFENHFSFFQSLLTFHLDFYGQDSPSFSINTGLELKPYLLKQLSLLLSFIVEDATSLSNAFEFSSTQANTFILARIAYLFGDYASLGFIYRRALSIQKENQNLRSSNEIAVQVGIVF